MKPPESNIESNSTMHVIGIDAGGTKTVCLVADEHGTVVAESRGAGANLHAAGEAGVERALRDVMADALGGSTIAASAICLGMAGIDREDEARVIHGIMQRLGQRSRSLWSTMH